MKIVYPAEKIIPYKNEVLRYLGYKKPGERDNVSDVISQKVDSCILSMHKVLKPQMVCDFFPASFLDEYNINTMNLKKATENSSYIIIMAATIGPMVDKLILQSQKTDCSDAVILQATGAMFIESFVDSVCNNFQVVANEKGYKLKPRFSPGFGDVILDNQKFIFNLLRCTQQIGLTLNDSLIMSPEKSITAFIGIEKL